MKPIALAIALSVAAISPNTVTAKNKVPVSEAAEEMLDVCIAAKGDKRRAEQTFGPASGFKRVQSTDAQSVASHRTKDLTLLLIKQGNDLTCMMNFEPTGDAVEGFYSFKSELATQLDIPEAEFKEEGTTLVYRSTEMETLMRWSSGVSTSVSFQ
jgi:hypothetical protein